MIAAGMAIAMMGALATGVICRVTAHDDRDPLFVWGSRLALLVVGAGVLIAGIRP